MAYFINEQCVGCTVCSPVCPVKAIRSLIVVDGLGLHKGLNIPLNSESVVRFYPICSGG